LTNNLKVDIIGVALQKEKGGNMKAVRTVPTQKYFWVEKGEFFEN
jgi:hypothetical protein